MSASFKAHLTSLSRGVTADASGPDISIKHDNNQEPPVINVTRNGKVSIEEVDDDNCGNGNVPLQEKTETSGEIDELKARIADYIIKIKEDERNIQKLNKQIQRLHVKLEASHAIARDQIEGGQQCRATILSGMVHQRTGIGTHVSSNTDDIVNKWGFSATNTPKSTSSSTHNVFAVEAKPLIRAVSNILPSSSNFSSAVSETVVSRNIELLSTLEQLHEEAGSMKQEYEIKVVDLVSQLEELGVLARALETENAALKNRISDEVLLRQQTNRLEMASRKTIASRQLRLSGMRRLEMMEREIMQCHDDLFHVMRFDSRMAPVRDITMVYFCFSGIDMLRRRHQEAAMTLLGIYQSIISRVAQIYTMHLICHKEQFAAYASQSALKALHFAIDVQIYLLEQPWPEKCVVDPPLQVVSAKAVPVVSAGSSAHHNSIPMTHADSVLPLFSGPRLQCVLYACNPVTSVDPLTGRMIYSGSEVTNALEMLIERTRPGEIAANALFVTKVINESKGPNSNNMTLGGVCLPSGLDILRKILDIEPLDPLEDNKKNTSSLSLTSLKTAIAQPELSPGLVAAKSYSLLPIDLRRRRQWYPDVTQQVGKNDRDEVDMLLASNILRQSQNPATSPLIGRGLMDVAFPDKTVKIIQHHARMHDGQLPTHEDMQGYAVAALLRPLHPVLVSHRLGGVPTHKTAGERFQSSTKVVKALSTAVKAFQRATNPSASVSSNEIVDDNSIFSASSEVSRINNGNVVSSQKITSVNKNKLIKDKVDKNGRLSIFHHPSIRSDASVDTVSHLLARPLTAPNPNPSPPLPSSIEDRKGNIQQKFDPTKEKIPEIVVGSDDNVRAKSLTTGHPSTATLLRDLYVANKATTKYYSLAHTAQRVNRCFELQKMFEEDRYLRQRHISLITQASYCTFVCLSVRDWTEIQRRLLALPSPPILSVLTSTDHSSFTSAASPMTGQALGTTLQNAFECVLRNYRSITMRLLDLYNGTVLRDSHEDVIMAVFTCPRQALKFCCDWFITLSNDAGWPLPSHVGNYVGLSPITVPDVSPGAPPGSVKYIFKGPRGAHIGVCYGRPSVVLRRYDRAALQNFIYPDNHRNEIDMFGSILGEAVTLNSIARPGELLVTGDVLEHWKQSDKVHVSPEFSVMNLGQRLLHPQAPTTREVYSVLPAALAPRQKTWPKVNVVEKHTYSGRSSPLIRSQKYRSNSPDRNAATLSASPFVGNGPLVPGLPTTAPSINAVITAALPEMDTDRIITSLGLHRSCPQLCSSLAHASIRCPITQNDVENVCREIVLSALFDQEVKTTNTENATASKKYDSESVVALSPQQQQQVFAAESRFVRNHPLYLDLKARIAEKDRTVEEQTMRLHDLPSGMLGEVPPPSIYPEFLDEDRVDVLGRVVELVAGVNLTKNSSFTGNTIIPRIVTGTCPAAFLLYVDIEGSRSMLENAPDAFLRAQQHYNLLVLEAVMQHDGYVVKHNGQEAFLIAVFCPTPSITDAALTDKNGVPAGRLFTPQVKAAANALSLAFTIQHSLLETVWPPEILRHESALRLKEAKTGAVVFNGLRARCGIVYATNIMTQFFLDVPANNAVGPADVSIARRTNFTGAAVQQVARLAKSAPGGDIWVSLSVYGLLSQERTQKVLPNAIRAVNADVDPPVPVVSVTHDTTMMGSMSCVTRPIYDNRHDILAYGILPRSLATRIQRFSPFVLHNQNGIIGGMGILSSASAGIDAAGVADKGGPRKINYGRSNIPTGVAGMYRRDLVSKLFLTIEDKDKGSPEWWWNQQHYCGTSIMASRLLQRQCSASPERKRLAENIAGSSSLQFRGAGGATGVAINEAAAAPPTSGVTSVLSSILAGDVALTGAASPATCTSNASPLPQQCDTAVLKQLQQGAISTTMLLSLLDQLRSVMPSLLFQLQIQQQMVQYGGNVPKRGSGFNLPQINSVTSETGDFLNVTIGEGATGKQRPGSASVNPQQMAWQQQQVMAQAALNQVFTTNPAKVLNAVFIMLEAVMSVNSAVASQGTQVELSKQHSHQITNSVKALEEACGNAPGSFGRAVDSPRRVPEPSPPAASTVPTRKPKPPLRKPTYVKKKL